MAAREPLSLVLLASLAVSLALLRGHVLPLDAITEPGGDHGLMAWNLWVVNESVLAGRNPYVTDLVYALLGARMMKHTLVAGFWPLTFLADVATGDDPRYPLHAYRLAILTSFTLALALTYRVLRRVGASPLAAAAPAVLYAFSPFSRLHVPHLNHVSAAFLLPATALALLRLVERPGPPRAAAFAVVLGIAPYFSELAAFLWLAWLVLALLVAAHHDTRAALLDLLHRLGPRGLAAAGAAFALTVGPFLLQWGLDSGIAPKARQAANWSANLFAFVVPSPQATPLYAALAAPLDAHLSGIRGHEAFLGFPLMIGAAWCLARRRSAWDVVLGALAGIFLALALGPHLKVGPIATSWPLPYALLMKVPPFEQGRTPVRNVLFALLPLAMLATRGLTRMGAALGERWGTRAAQGMLAVVLAWSVAEVWTPVPWAAPYEVPADLALLRPGPVVNLPLSVFDGTAVFLQMFHHHPIVTGFVSRRTPAQVAQVRQLDALLESDPPAFAAELQRRGVGSVIASLGTPRATIDALRRLGVHVLDLRGAEVPLHRLPPPSAAEEDAS